MAELQYVPDMRHFGFRIGERIKVKSRRGESKTSGFDITTGTLVYKSNKVFGVKTKWGYIESFNFSDHAVGIAEVTYEV